MKVKTILVTLVVLEGLACAILGLALVKKKQFAAMGESRAHFAMPATTVTSAEVSSQIWGKSLFAVGSLSPARGVMLSTEVSGVVEAIAFESGQEVNEGDVLLVLNTSAEQASKKAAEAKARLAKLKLDRTKELRSKQTVSEAALDAAEAEYLEAAAQVESIEVMISKKQIVAPFSGRVGIRQVNVGQFVNVGTAIVSLQSLDPIYADFSLPQQKVSELEVGLGLDISVDAFPEETFEGALTAINSEVDVSTRSIRLRGTMSNRDGRLRSGMFVGVNLKLPKQDEVLVVPATAILYASYGDSVYVIEESEAGLSVKRALVEIGETRGDFVSILSGLEAGQRVVSSGVFKLSNGASVQIDNTLAPDAKLDPKPEDS